MNAYSSPADDRQDSGAGDLQGLLRDAVAGIRQASPPHERMIALLDRAANWPLPVSKARWSWRFAVVSAVAAAVVLIAITAIVLKIRPAESPLATAGGQDSQTQDNSVLFGNQPKVEAISEGGMPAADVAAPAGDDGAVPAADGVTAASDDGVGPGFGAQASPAPAGVALGGVRAGGLAAGASPSRSFAVAEHASVIVSTGGEKPIKLGEQQPFSRENRLHVWDWSKGDESRPLAIEAGNFAVSPDGKTIVTHEGQAIQIETGEVKRLPHFDDAVQRVKFSPDGTMVVLQIGTPVGTNSQATIRVLDFPSGEKRVDIPDQFVYMFDVAFTPDGRELVVMSKDMSIRRFHAASGMELMKYEPPHTNSIRDIAISPDGERLASAGPDGEVFLWELKTGKLIGKLTLRYPNFGYDDQVQSLAFSPDSKLLAGGGLVRLVLWNAASGELEHLLESWQSGGARHLRFSPDGAEITTVLGFHGTTDDAGRDVLVYPTVRAWKVERGK